jgi:ESCRT-I complex subunit TSG101
MYNIPVNIWIPHSYPHTPPFVFVTPTDSMVIKESKNVEIKGKVHLPYLHYWPSRPDQSNLVELVRILCVVFGQHPPVYNKTSGKTPSPIKTPSSPLPSDTLLRTVAPAEDLSKRNLNLTTPSSTSISTSGSVSRHPTSSSLPPPSPPPMPMEATSLGQTNLSPSRIPEQPYRSTPVSQRKAPSHPDESRSNHSLQSAVFEKIQQQLRMMEQSKTREMETLLRINAQLRENSQKLTSDLKTLTEEGKKIDANIESVQRKIQDMKDLVNISESEQELDVDEILLTDNAIYRQ